MNYNEVLDYMYSQLPMYQRQGKAAYKSDLGNTLLLDEKFNHPHRSYKTIHVAGTNGKGSVSHMIASILQESGFKVGLYTSPHLRDFRERVKINGELIKKEFVVDFIEENRDSFEEIKPSFFEMTVAMAFKYFEESNIDIAVIETGLGGRLDSTNIISPLLSIITNIGMDHTELLGDTVEKIALEKAGIIKSDIPVVIGQTQSDAIPVFKNKAEEVNANIFIADEDIKIENITVLDDCQEFDIINKETLLYKDLKLDLLGDYQQKNVITVLKSISVLNEFSDLKIQVSDIYNGLSKVVNSTGLLGRWQVLGENPKIICDTGHNFDGVTFIINQLKKCIYENLHIVFGVVNDKNIDRILELLPENAIYYFTKANIPRALDENILMEKAKKVDLKGNSYKSVEVALNNAKKNAGVNDLIFIGGSTFVVAEVV